MKTNNRRSAFTIIELLVVVGIIVLLAGLLLPMLYKTYRSASKTRLAADLNTIGVALDAYKSDFGDYPRVTVPGTGFAVLGKALVGPYDRASIALSVNPSPGGPPYKAGSVGSNSGTFSGQFVALRETTAAPPGADWAQFAYSDGADGPGFRVGANRVDTDGNGTLDAPGGKTFGPYLPVGKFRQQGLALLDHNGSPILYFPASPVKINLNVGTAVYVGSGGTPIFNFDDNGTLALSLNPDTGNTAAKALSRMHAMVGLRGDYVAPGTRAGQLMPGLTPVNQPYLLWSPGADGYFGPLEDISSFSSDASLVDRAVRRCDDVANITLPQ
ncbi:MAG: type II secretion system protein [Burkholderiales bacterium]|nr:type II secretion system protein [Phycisphaerae bacterium]